MGVISACFGGIIRDVLGKEDSILFSREIYVTAAVAAAATFVGLAAMRVARELSVGLALAAGFGLRAGALAFGWSLPRYKPRAPDRCTTEALVAQGATSRQSHPLPCTGDRRIARYPSKKRAPDRTGVV